MRAARYHGPRDVRVEEVEPRSPGPNEVRIEVAACGICGSDLHAYADGPGSIPEEPHPVTGESMPVVVGHEVGGTVAEVGTDVDAEVGAPVAVNPIVWCGDCRECAAGNYHLCANGGFVGLSGGGGGFAEELVVSAEKVVPFPESVPVELAALVEPYAVGLHAVRRSPLRAGDSVAVFGCGPIGLAVVEAARAAGAGDVFASEPRRVRRELAGECGADHLVDPSEADPVEVVRERTDGGADVAFEVAGTEPTLRAAANCTRTRGAVVAVGIFDGAVPFDPNGVVTGERTVVGSAAYLGGPRSAEEFSATIRNFAAGTFDPERLVTDRIDLDDVVTGGYERLLDDGGEQVKVLVRP